MINHRGFLINDAICRRYPGAFRHPLDPELVALPWWIKEAIVLLAIREQNNLSKSRRV